MYGNRRDRRPSVGGRSSSNSDADNTSPLSWTFLRIARIIASFHGRNAHSRYDTAVIQRTTCASRHPQLRTEGFCWSEVSLSTINVPLLMAIRIVEKIQDEK